MAKRSSIATEHKIEEFAEDLGKLLGSATAKAESWIGERQQIVKHLTDVRDTASKLLNDLGHQAQSAVAAGTKAFMKRGGRPTRYKNKVAVKPSPATTSVAPHMHHDAEPVVSKQRTMSAKARKAISMAQKARWAKQRSGNR